ncbi:MAG: replication-associated recombination protein A [Clostridia bacterium]|nr:replication-associated recombination protein A [Clostridia bacterium]
MEPLAYRMKPKELKDFFGQEDIIGEGKLLNRLIKADKLTSAIFWGPPGCGKTSLARIIANTTKNKFVTLNATTAGVADIKSVVEKAQNIFENPTGKVILFIDEIHRFNKLQQDALLPHVEKGTVILIGATTENPYFSVNKALISRSTVFKFKELEDKDVVNVLKNCIQDKENGLGNYNLEIKDGVLEFLASNSNGDVRSVLNALELAILTTNLNENGQIVITKDVIRDCIQQKKSIYDKSDDSHYDVISAFIKSMRGSDPDATLHYLARMLEGGEDPMFIARRIVIQSSEDVGLANGNALQVAVAAMQAVHQIGMPEARIPLAQAALTVALSPKSNTSYLGINEAIEDVRTLDIGQVPMHIRNAAKAGMEEFGYGEGYKYPHNFENSKVEQQYLPDKLLDKKYFKPKSWEKDLGETNEKR